MLQRTLTLVKGTVLATTILAICWAQSCRRGAFSQPQPRELFAAYIREGLGQTRMINECQPRQYGLVEDDSELTVLDDGEIKYRVSTGILCNGSRPIIEPDAHFGSRWKDRLPEKGFRSKLSRDELDKLKTFLEREDVLRQESFLSAAPAPAEYRFIIARQTGIQNIEVIGFAFRGKSEEKMSGQNVSGVSAIICLAKTLAHRTSNSAEGPAWCQGFEPFGSKK